MVSFCTPAILTEAVERFVPDLRRNVFSFEWQAFISPETTQRYPLLCQQSGLVYAQMQADQEFQGTILRENLRQLEKRFANLQLEFAEARKENSQLTSASENVVTILREIQSYRSWRAVNKWWHLRSQFLPIGTWQENIYFGGVAFIESLIKFGPRVALRKAFSRNQQQTEQNGFIPQPSLLSALGFPEAVRQILFGSIIVAVAAAYTRITAES